MAAYTQQPKKPRIKLGEHEAVLITNI
jgi:hypothetical protein